MLMNDDGYYSMGPRGRFYPYLYQVIDIGIGLYLGRAPRTKETLPDIHECFRGLTGSQRTPRFWGVTKAEIFFFNEFILPNWKMKTKIYISFCGFPVARMKKKKKREAEIGWATAHLSHDTVHCIVTQAHGAHSRGNDTASSAPRDGPQLGHDTAERPHDTVSLRARPAVRAQGPGRWE